MKQNQRIHLPESTLRLLAEGIANRVTIRYYDGGTSHDYTCDSTPEDRSAIFPVAFGSLLGLNYGEEARSGDGEQVVMNTAEFTIMHLLPRVNTYDTIYNPLRAVLEAWRVASSAVRPRSSLSDWASRYIWDRFPDWLDFLNGVMAYPQPDNWVPYTCPDDAAVTLEAWKCDGIAKDMPAQDAGMLFLMWNLYVSDRSAAEGGK